MGSVVYPWIGYNLLCASTLGRWAGALPILWVILLSYVYIQIFLFFFSFFRRKKDREGSNSSAFSRREKENWISSFNLLDGSLFISLFLDDAYVCLFLRRRDFEGVVSVCIPFLFVRLSSFFDVCCGTRRFAVRTTVLRGLCLGALPDAERTALKPGSASVCLLDKALYGSVTLKKMSASQQRVPILGVSILGVLVSCVRRFLYLCRFDYQWLIGPNSDFIIRCRYEVSPSDRTH